MPALPKQGYRDTLMRIAVKGETTQHAMLTWNLVTRSHCLWQTITPTAHCCLTSRHKLRGIKHQLFFNAHKLSGLGMQTGPIRDGLSQDVWGLRRKDFNGWGWSVHYQDGFFTPMPRALANNEEGEPALLVEIVTSPPRFKGRKNRFRLLMGNCQG